MRIYKTIRPAIFKMDPENAHNLAIKLLQHNPFSPRIEEYPNLHQNLWNIDFKNPVGMAAGFDKNAQIATKLSKFGFGFIECGTVTPKAQIGNEKPRIFRLEQDEAIINRLGFNNLGAENFAENVSRNALHQKNENLVLGINIGKNKNTQNAITDYSFLLEKFYAEASYITINISSPNTANLRDLQSEDQLDLFLSEIMKHKSILKDKHSKNIPILLKIAPDLSEQEQEQIAKTIIKNQIDGVIISNTTISRDLNLKSPKANSENLKAGGLSGKPLLEKSNEVLRNFYKLTDGKIPLIGVGGVSCAQDAYEKIKSGASLVQIYSAFIYQGFGLVEEIKKDLAQLVKKDGFNNISQAIGSSCK